MTIKMTPIKKTPGLYWYKDKNGEKKYAYRYRYYDNLGKRKETTKSGFEFEQEAKRALLDIQIQVEDKKFIELSNRNITVRDWLAQWLQANTSNWKAGTIQQREIIIRKHLVPTIGNCKLRTLTKETYQIKFLNVKVDELSPRTLETAHSIFKIAVNAAVESEILDRNRFKKITLPEKKETKKMLTAKELKKIFDYVSKYEDPTVKTLVQLLSRTGMRLGEALGLKWSDIDYEEKKIVIERTRKTTNKFVRSKLTTPKTKNSYRTIEIDESTLDMLNSYRIQCKARHLHFGSTLHDDNLLFMTFATLNDFSMTAASSAFTRISNRTGVKVTAHMFRHSVASYLLANGKSVASVAALLGDSQKTVIRYYSHVIESEKKELTNVMQNLIENM